MFKLGKRTYTWPVSVDLPADGGKWDVFKFNAKFLVIPKSEVDELVKNESSDGDNPDLLKRVFVGFEAKDLVDEDGNPVSDDEHGMSLMQDDPCVRVALVRAYFKSIGGRERKN